MNIEVQEIQVDKYPAYKDSGVEWLGEIPEHWDLTRLGSILNPVSSKNHPDETLLSITREKGVIIRDIENENENHNYIPDDLTGYKLLKQGQFGMNKMKAWQGSYGVSSFDGIVSPAYYTFEFIKDIEPTFFHLAIRSKLYVSYFGQASDGVRIGQWDLSKDRMKQIPFVIPPLHEQQAIANFLNDKYSKVDAAIAIKQKQIALLRERRQIAIHQAVTRGLDKNVPLKDSGVEWIGEIPEHWVLVPIRRLISITDGTHDTPLYLEKSLENFPLITSKDFLDGEIHFLNCKYISKLDHSEIKKRSGVEMGDVLMSMIGGNIGKSVIVKCEREFSVKNVAIFKTIGDFSLSKFILFYIESGLLDRQIAINSKGGAQGFLSLGDVRNLLFFKMPLIEQQAIVTHLEELTTKIDTAISIKQQEIEKLKEYKTTLINSAVTGKIMVPEVN